MAAAGASVAVALGGDRTPAAAPPTTSHAALPRAVPKPADCASWGCTKAQSVDLGRGYAISLWHAGKSGDMRTDPVVELTDRGVSVQWLLWSRGYGWSGSLKCSTAAAAPSCIITDGAGVHSAAAQLVILRSGKLVFPAKSYVIADLPTITVRDLDDDGDLDVVALDSDYTPNFAEGHLYWRTYRNAGGQLSSTGCMRQNSPADPPPITALTGPCPHP